MINLNFKLSQKALILVAVPLVFEMVFVATLYHLLMQSKQQALKERNAKEIVVVINEVNKLYFDGISALVTYALVKNQTFSERFDEIVSRIQVDLHTLKTRVINDPPQRLRAARINLLVNRTLTLLESKQHELQDGSGSLATIVGPNLLEVMRGSTTQLIAEMHQFAEGELALQKESAGSASRSDALVFYCLAVGVILNIVLAVSLAAFFNRGTTRRLSVLMDNTLRLALQKPLNAPLTGGDEIAHLDRTFHEMSAALAEAIRKERAAVENAVEVICSINAEGKLQAVNPASERSWGYIPAELIGRDLLELVIPEDVGLTRQFIADAAVGGGNVTVENRMRKADGKSADMLWSAQWSVRDKALFCVVHDVTERRELDRLKREFVAMVSHDLRTPLNSMQALLSLLVAGAYGDLSETGHESVSATEQDIERLITMVNDLLDIEKMESGKLELHFERTSVSELLWRAVRAVSGFAEQNLVTLKVIPTKAEVNADGDRLIQVIVNLASNAIKFSPENSTVTLSAVESPDSIVVKVTDKGRGIPVEMKEAIFDRFKQVDRSDGSGRKGAGLGLAICQAIIDQHNGQIGVDSEVGKGSTFWFRIPRQQGLLSAENSSSK